MQGETMRSAGNTTAQQGSPMNHLIEVAKNYEYLALKSFQSKIKAGFVVNCWYCGDEESEAMWKIYSDNNKGIELITNFNSLLESLEDNNVDGVVNIGKVWYIDYDDKNLSSQDCVVDGLENSPLIKRKSYEHEKELRLFMQKTDSEIVGELDDAIPTSIKTAITDLMHKINALSGIEYQEKQSLQVSINDIYGNSVGPRKAKPKRVSVNLEKLIKEIRISPLVSEPFVSSVKSACKQYGFGDDVVKQSDLLNIDRLFD